jgi:hypothetical protein
MLSYSRKMPLFQKMKVRKNQIKEENGFLCISAMQFGENPTFRRNISSLRRVEEHWSNSGRIGLSRKQNISLWDLENYQFYLE